MSKIRNFLSILISSVYLNISYLSAKLRTIFEHNKQAIFRAPHDSRNLSYIIIVSQCHIVVSYLQTNAFIGPLYRTE